MNSSITIGKSGARPHGVEEDKGPVDSKIFMFVLSLQLTEYYIINNIRSSTMKDVYVYIYRVINDL
jgi:hypothetical protein